MDNRPSHQLTDIENEIVFSAIGRRNVTLSTTIAQLYHCPPGDSQWQKLCVGAACFVKDNVRRSYYITVVNVVKQNVEWEQEIYNSFTYNVKSVSFHSFEADDCVAGLNFSIPAEAEHFRQAIEEKLQVREQRKIERKRTTLKRPPAEISRPSKITQTNTKQVDPISAPTIITDITINKKTGKGGKKVKLTKGDIGAPSGFQHVSHVGWDPKGGFDANNIEPQWKKLFDSAGVTEGQLQDEDTSQFIYNFIEQNGGIEKATEELERSRHSKASPPTDAHQVPSPRPRTASNPPTPRQRPARPPPIPPPQPTRSAPPPPPSTVPPPPPLSLIPRPPGATPVSRRDLTAIPAQPPTPPPPPPPPPGIAPAPPPPLSNVSAPPPPPPPPPPVGSPPAPPPPELDFPPPPPSAMAGVSSTESPQQPPSGGGRGGLLDQIHAGMKLKKVTESTGSESDNGGNGGSRSDLLSEIQKGRSLRSVADGDRPSSDPAQFQGIAGALAAALADRGKHIQVEDSDGDDSEFDDEEWED